MQDISLHILDVVQNAITAAASLIEISLFEILDAEEIRVTIRDNGKGMNDEEAKGALDPFYTTRTTRKVGLGIPLFKASAEASGGTLYIESAKGKGTTIQAIFCSTHIDCIPIGNMSDTMITLIVCNPDIDFIYKHQYGDVNFILETTNIRSILQGVPIDRPEVIEWITQYIKEGLNDIYGGAI